MKKALLRLVLSGVVILALLLAGCSGSKQAQAPAKGDGKSGDAPALANLSGPEKERVAKLIEGAKAEGRAAIWSSGLTPELVKDLESDFKQKYGLPDFKMEFSNVPSSEMITRANQEIKAGKVTVDILSSSIPDYYYDLIKQGELMKYESPEYKNYRNINGATFEPGYWVASFSWSPVVMWNPDIIKKDIKTYQDILDPQFKGKICMGDGIKSDTYLNAYRGLRIILGKDYMEKLAALEPIFLTRSPDLTNKVITGEYPIAFTGNARTAYLAALEGAKINVLYPQEGVVLLASPFVILQKAPHPNSAKLMIDYLHTEKAQAMMQMGSGYIMGRDGLSPPDKVVRFAPPIEKIKVIPADWKGQSNMMDIEEARKEFRELFIKK